MIEGLDRIIHEHPVFAGLDGEYLRLITGCARNLRFEPGSYLCHEGEAANEFFLLRHGKVALEIVAPGVKPLVFTTLDEGAAVGASWLAPPYRWNYDARAVTLTRAIGIDAACLRGKCEADHHFGYAIMKRFLPVLVDRLHAANLQLLDVYGHH